MANNGESAKKRSARVLQKALNLKKSKELFMSNPIGDSLKDTQLYADNNPSQEAKKNSEITDGNSLLERVDGIASLLIPDINESKNGDVSRGSAIQLATTPSQREMKATITPKSERSAPIAYSKPQYIKTEELNRWADGIIEEINNSTPPWGYEGSEKDAIKALLIKLDLLNVTNIKNFKLAPRVDTIKILSIHLGCQLEGKEKLTKTCYDKLMKVIELINLELDIDDQEEKGLRNLAMTGLLNEKNLELYAAQPSAFRIDDDEEDSETEILSDVRAKLQNVASQVMDEIREPNEFFKKSTSSEMEALRTTLVKSNLFSIDNMIYFKKYMNKPNSLSLINSAGGLILSALSVYASCPLEKEQIDQACYEKLGEVATLLSSEDDEELNGLMYLAQAGLLSEENLELYAAQPSLFNIEIDPSEMNDDGSLPIEKAGELRTSLEEVIRKLKLSLIE